jgi:hypothetical protein
MPSMTKSKELHDAARSGPGQDLELNAVCDGCDLLLEFSIRVSIGA